MSQKTVTERTLFIYDLRIISATHPQQASITTTLYETISALKSANTATPELDFGIAEPVILNPLSLKRKDSFTMISYKIPRRSGNNTSIMDTNTQEERNLQNNEKIIDSLHLVVDEKNTRLLFWAVTPYNNPNIIISAINKALLEMNRVNNQPEIRKIELKKIVVGKWKSVLEDKYATFKVKKLIAKEVASDLTSRDTPLFPEKPPQQEEIPQLYTEERTISFKPTKESFNNYEFKRFMELIDFENRKFSKMRIEVRGKDQKTTTFTEKGNEPISYAQVSCKLNYTYPPEDKIFEELINLLKTQ